MDPYVQLARLGIEHYVRHGRPLREIPEEIRAALGGIRGAVFVSLHTLDHELRGCIGTILPHEANVIEEILQNGIAACSRDSRFPPVRPEELPDLDIRVDVLSGPEPVQDRSQLDPRKYGVIVTTRDGRRGLLLPDLEGVDTVDQQVSIACRKALIDERRDSYGLERFTVTRHTA
jgi:AmmeMemoRadiSam system protein A